MNRLAALLLLATLGLSGSGCDRRVAEEVVDAKPPAVAAKPPSISEQTFRSGMQLDEVKSVVYKDENGSVISFDEFISSVRAGRSFGKVVEADKSLAEVSIDAVKAAGPNEQPKNSALNVPVGSEMPLLKAMDISGNTHQLNNGQHYTLLSFFFSDCVPCIQEIPQLNSLQASVKNIRLVSVTFDDKATAERFARERGLELPIVAGSQDYIDALGIKTYPTLVLVSPEGRLVGARTSYVPPTNEKAGVKELEEWLSSFGVKS